MLEIRALGTFHFGGGQHPLNSGMAKAFCRAALLLPHRSSWLPVSPDVFMFGDSCTRIILSGCPIDSTLPHL